MQASGMPEDGFDPTDAQAVVTKARAEFAAGNEKEAARLLTDAAYLARDPEIERQVRELAAQGLEQAGRFGKGRWKEVIRIVDSLQTFRSQSGAPISTA